MKTKFLQLNESDIQSLGILNSVHRNFRYTPVRLRNIDGVYCQFEFSIKGNTTDSFFRFFSQLPVVDFEDPVIEEVYSANEPAVDDPIWFNHLPYIFSESVPPPKTLYHYTSASGLLGILPQNRLWATHFSFLNDKSEFNYCKNLIKSVVEEYAMKNPQLTSLALRISDSDIKGSVSGLDAFLISLCGAEDLLGLWRAYSNGGAGYCIGLNFHEIGLRVLRDSKPPTFTLVPVEYDEEKQLSRIRPKIELEIKRFLHAKQSQPDRHHEHRAIHDIFTKCLLEIVSFKHPVFKEEREYRIIQFMGRPLPADPIDQTGKFRQANSHIVPCLELDISPDAGDNANRIPINKVLCGPLLEPETARLGVKKLLSTLNRFNIDVSSSIIPLR